MQKNQNELNPPLFSWSNIAEEKYWFQKIQTIIENTSTSALWNRKHGLTDNNTTTHVIQSLEEINQLWMDGINQISKEEQQQQLTNNNNCVESNNTLQPMNQEQVETASHPKQKLLQEVALKLWTVVQKYGTYYLDDLLFLLSAIIYKKSRVDLSTRSCNDKLRILNKYFHIFHCKIMTASQLSRELGGRVTLNDAAQMNYLCLSPETKHSYYFRIHGVRLLIQIKDKIYMIYGVFEDILPSTLPCQHPDHFLYQSKTLIVQQGLTEGYKDTDMHDFVSFMSLSDFFLFPYAANTHVTKPNMASTLAPNESLTDTKSHIKTHFERIETLERLVLNNKIETIVKKFNDMTSFDKILFFRYLLQSKNIEVHYITSLLYDLFTLSGSSSTASRNVGDTSSIVNNDFNNMIYNSLPWKLKQSLKNSVNNSLQHLQSYVVAYDANRISLEQQVFLMRVPERVKEKAFMKLREIKSKSEEMNGKARQYLDGLLRIPFGQIREEPLLTHCYQLRQRFKQLFPENSIPSYDLSTMYDCMKKKIDELDQERAKTHFWLSLKIDELRTYAESVGIKTKKRSKIDIIDDITNLFQREKRDERNQNQNKDHNPSQSTCNEIPQRKQSHAQDIQYNSVQTFIDDILKVKQELKTIENTLDQSVYGHKEAKNKIMQVIGQWLSSGDKKQGGYCFGFEGEPGIGKTSLANQGLSQCLKDENGQPRPFHVIALGGCCNSSTLEGHGYTYSNSAWGRIVDILMESKCMNPIIYIDELDKVSKTENGKEIIGILIHIIDSSQNTGFQDKYFSGIDIDLSQVLFVFSYNNPEDIDKILLDRIHRIPFDSLSLKDKVVITKQYILPTLENKFGFTPNTVQIDNETIEHIIDTYTNESGIRKTKQLFFDIYSQINLDLLNCKMNQLPVALSQQAVDSKYLHKAHKNIVDMIHTKPEVGVMNALYATHNGNGGIIKIECMMIPATHMLDMKLTGSLGKVFTESMEICKNLAWSLLSEETKKAWLHKFEQTRVQGLHVHFGDCNTPKEGASASLASALTIYSVFTNQRLRNDIAMTGETNLFGHAKRIGGIDAKFLGGIKAGVKIFFYPEENQEEVDRFFEKVGDKYKDTHEFYAISDLRQVIHHPVGIFTIGTRGFL